MVVQQWLVCVLGHPALHHHLRIFLSEPAWSGIQVPSWASGEPSLWGILPVLRCLPLEQVQLHHSLFYIMQQIFLSVQPLQYGSQLCVCLCVWECVCVKYPIPDCLPFRIWLSIPMTISADCFYVNQGFVCTALLYLRTQAEFRPLFCYVWKANL